MVTRDQFCSVRLVSQHPSCRCSFRRPPAVLPPLAWSSCKTKLRLPPVAGAMTLQVTVLTGFLLSLMSADEYPQLSQVPLTSFTCRSRPPGYYADPDPLSRCQVFHMCNMEGRRYSYLCPNLTLFHQERLICDHWHKVNCSDIERRWDVNNHLYPDLPAKEQQKPTVRSARIKIQRNAEENHSFRVKPRRRTEEVCGYCLSHYLQDRQKCSPCVQPR